MCYENLFIDILLHVFLKQEECFIDSGGMETPGREGVSPAQGRG